MFNVNYGKIGKISKKKCKVDLLVVRFTKDGKNAISRPCNMCLNYLKNIKNVTIRKIYFFNEKGELVCQKLRKMTYDHVSIGFRLLESTLSMK
jgi:hypothetical protein